MNVLREECKGAQVWIKELQRPVEVNEENIPTLLAYGKTEFFITKDELKPVAQKEVKVDNKLEPLLIEKLRAQALNNFEGISIKDAKKACTKAGVDFPNNATSKSLAKIVLDYKDDLPK